MAIVGFGQMLYNINDGKEQSAECGGGTIIRKNISYGSKFENGS